MPLDEPLPTEQPLLVFTGVLLRTGKEARRSRSQAKRSCTGTPRACRAPRSARRSTWSPARPRSSNTVEPDGSPVTYELKLVSIARTVEHRARGSRSRRLRRGEPQVGRELLQQHGLTAVPGLQYSPERGGFVLPRQPAFGARAHAAAQPPRPGAPSSEQISLEPWRSV